MLKVVKFFFSLGKIINLKNEGESYSMFIMLSAIKDVNVCLVALIYFYLRLPGNLLALFIKRLVE